MKYLSLVFFVCLCLYFTNCINLKGSSTKKIENKDQLMAFDLDWDRSTMAEVEIDDIFTEISDKNLEKAEIYKSKASEHTNSCSTCVPTPPQFQ
jgi:hypothetical protein